MIDLIIMVFLFLLTLTFFTLYIIQKKTNETLISKTLETLLIQQMTNAANKTDKEQANEDFLKFVSDSRDWAYQYIEDVQAGIKSFVDQVGPQIDHYDKYGIAVEGMISPHDFALKKISVAFKELKKFLPEEKGGTK